MTNTQRDGESVEPVRIQLSRKKGFRLQNHSHDLNGLDCVNVARPSKYGNPARVGDWFKVGDFSNSRFSMSWCKALTPETQKPPFTYITENIDAVHMFKALADNGYFEKFYADLRGKNLACWCKLNEPCHADVLLELSNRQP